MSLSDIFNSPFAIPLTAIIGGFILGAIKLQMSHAERMAMIAQGMHPDDPRKSHPRRVESEPAGERSSPST